MAPKNPPEPMQIAAQLTSPRFVIVSGEVVRRLRMERGMTQLQLARAAGYTERLIRKAEKGGRLDIRTVQNLAEALSQFGNHLSVEICAHLAPCPAFTTLALLQCSDGSVEHR